MPRRPVRPEDRQRVARACEPCKASKKRCDGKQPCNGCGKKGNVDSCTYTPSRRRNAMAQQKAPQKGITWASTTSSTSRMNDIPESMMSPVSDRDNPGNRALSPHSTRSGDAEGSYDHEGDDSFDDETEASGHEVPGQPPVMLSSVSGEKVFVGNSAAISFLRFLQKTLEHHAGPSCFTNAKESHNLFEVDTTNIDPSSVYDGLSMEEKRIYIQHFLDASSGLLDLYSWEEISQLIDGHEPITPNTPRQRLENLQIAALYLMIAIGAQCRGHGEDDLAWAAKLFSYARKLALENMLEDPSLGLVRVFLLMAFYMFGACRRNSAFMYLGVASKAADILGLCMSSQYRHLHREARNARLRTAKSLRVFDVICNSIMGRTSSTPALCAGHTSYVTSSTGLGHDATYKALALGASYEVSAILDSAVSKFAQLGSDMDAAERIVLALQQSSRTFPSVLRHHNTDAEPNSRHVAIGNVHVAGVYYFSVILATRHFLIEHVVPQLSAEKHSQSGRNDSSVTVTAQCTKTEHLAEACIEAATFMAQMCYQAMRSGLLLGNMCILKAWMFATGLVLGFSLLEENDKSSAERRTAFVKSLHVLGHLKRLSPQAEQYYDILSSFYRSIKTYKEQLLREKRGSRDTLVDRVFVLDGSMDFGASDNITTTLPSPDLTAWEPSSVDWSATLDMNAMNDMEPVDPTLVGDNDVIMRMLWDMDRFAEGHVDPLLADGAIALDPQFTP